MLQKNKDWVGLNDFFRLFFFIFVNKFIVYQSIEIPKYVPPKEIDDLFKNIEKIVSDFQEDELENINDELMCVKGFIDVKLKEEIKERLRDNIQDNSEIKDKVLDLIKKFSFNN